MRASRRLNFVQQLAAAPDRPRVSQGGAERVTVGAEKWRSDVGLPGRKRQ
jgi:hypothetical protein